MSKFSRRSLLKMAAGLAASGVFAWNPDELKAELPTEDLGEWETTEQEQPFAPYDDGSFAEQHFAPYFLDPSSPMILRTSYLSGRIQNIIPDPPTFKGKFPYK